MKKRSLVVLSLAVFVLVATAAAWGYLRTRGEAPSEFRFAKTERGPIVAAVAATGTLNPVTSVQVGSQVSGQIKELYVDFNSAVKKDQVIARIDPEAFELQVRQATADLEAGRATVLTQMAAIGAQRAVLSKEEVTLADAKRDLDRKLILFEKNFVSASDRDKATALYNSAQEQVKSARAQLVVAEAQSKNGEAVVKQREAQLSQAKVNLDRTMIRSPVNGIVIKRSVDAGQTVAASLQAPELFIIAKNLTEMEVGASIDEADVGRIRVGQKASFTVDAFPGRSFGGEVKQVRKAALVVQNVVTYTVVVGTSNPDQLLLPGMTANVRIVTDERASVLKVPNAALRYRPTGLPDQASAGGGGAGTPAPSAPGASPAAATGGPGGAAQAMRQRLVTELKLDADQQSKLETIFADLRQKMTAARELPEADRPRAFERNRAEVRVRITEMLKPEQKPRYEEIAAEQTGRSGARGRVFVPGADGKPNAVTLQLGLSDGSMTEVVTGEIKEGDQIIIGTQTAGTSSSSSTAPRGPRMMF